MEKFDFEKLNLQKADEQEKFNNEFSKLNDYEKKLVIATAKFKAKQKERREGWKRTIENWNNDPKKKIATAEFEAEQKESKEEWKIKIETWKNDLETKNEIELLNKQIASNQENISEQIMEKIQNIYESHFAVHGCEKGLGNYMSILEDGIFSYNFSQQYSDKGLHKLRGTRSSVEQNHLKESESLPYNYAQGLKRISMNSPAPLLNILDKLKNNEKTVDKFIPISAYVRNTKEKYSADKLQKISKQLIQDYFSSIGIDIKIINIDFNGGYNDNGEEIGVIEIVNEKDFLGTFWDIWENKFLEKNIIKVLHRQMGEIGHPSYKESENSQNLFPFLESIYEQIEIGLENNEENKNEGDKNYWKMSDEAAHNLFNNIVSRLEEFKEEYLKFFYHGSHHYDYSQIIVDLNKVPDKLISKRLIPGLRIDPEDNKVRIGQPEQAYFQHPFETPIAGRVKPNWFSGFVSKESEKASVKFKQIIDEIIEITKRINIEKAKNISETDVELVRRIQQGIDRVDPKDILIFASKICNYNFFNENLSRLDLIKAMANFGKLPVYNKDGDLIWPTNITNKEIRQLTKNNK